MSLNAEQRAAVESTAAVTVVAAGPGSGKSHTLAACVRARIEAGTDPKRIIVLTFTNGGAHVFAQRLAPIVPGFMGTIHGFGIRLIQKVGNRIGYRAGSVSIVTEQTKETLLLATAKRLGVKLPKGRLLEGVGSGAELVWNEYRHELKRLNMIDYDQILVDAVKLLKLRDKADGLELFVDERQDSGAIDVEAFNAIAAVREFHVGDIDQSIFTFRGAEPRLFLELAHRHPHSTYVLTHNYRSDIAICEAATRLIAHNSHRILKPVISISSEQGSVTIVEVENDTAEVFQAYKLIKEAGVGFNECAILCRTNAIAERFRTMLRGFGVAVKQTTRRLPEDWSAVLSIIGMLIDPANNHHVERFLLWRGDKEADVEKMKLNALRASAPLSEMLRIPSITSLSEALDALVLLGVNDDSMELIRQRVAVLPNPEPTLSDLLADLWKHDAWNLHDEGEGVTVTTIHQAKGKEWDFVLVPALEEGILPHVKTRMMLEPGKSIDLADVEEERRLCFVAITRARHHLVLMHARQRTAFGKTTTQEPSRFLKEIK